MAVNAYQGTVFKVVVSFVVSVRFRSERRYWSRREPVSARDPSVEIVLHNRQPNCHRESMADVAATFHLGQGATTLMERISAGSHSPGT